MVTHRKRPLRKLTAKEVETVLALRAQGCTNAQIGEQFQVSGRTINGYVNHAKLRSGDPHVSAKSEVEPVSSLAIFRVNPYELAPEFNWKPAVSPTIRIDRVEPDDGLIDEVKPPLSLEKFANEYGQGLYRLGIFLGDICLFQSQIQISETYGPPRCPPR